MESAFATLHNDSLSAVSAAIKNQPTVPAPLTLIVNWFLAVLDALLTALDQLMSAIDERVSALEDDSSSLKDHRRVILNQHHYHQEPKQRQEF